MSNLKRAMLVMTILWPCAWIGLAYFWTTKSYATYYDIGSGVVRQRGVSESPLYTVSEAWTRSLIDGIVTGGVASTAVYGAIVFALFVCCFAIKKPSQDSAR